MLDPKIFLIPNFTSTSLEIINISKDHLSKIKFSIIFSSNRKYFWKQDFYVKKNSTFDWSNEIWQSIWILSFDGKIRLRKRSNVQGLTHLTLFLPFQLNGSKKTDNRRRKPRHSPTTTRDGFRSMDQRSWIPHINLIIGIFILGASASNVFSHVCIRVDGSVYRVMQCWWVWRHSRVQMYFI